MAINDKNDLLTPQELEDITGMAQPSRQAEVLRKNGIYFITRADGKIRTTWFHVHHAGTQTKPVDQEPRFDKVG